MPTSDFCPRPNPNPNTSQSGFTLLEMLVVLTLIGLITGLSLPQFSVIRDRIEFSMERESVERELGALSYSAMKDGEPLLLFGKYPRGIDNESILLKGSHFQDPILVTTAPGKFAPVLPPTSAEAKLTLPSAWNLTIDQPIIYHASGFCDGGEVKALVGRISYTYKLRSPVCVPELQK